MISWDPREFCSQRIPRQLTATIGDDFVDVHVKLGATSRHPNVEGKVIRVLSG
jgi:hypothetical protein